MSGNDASQCPHFAVYFTAGTNRTAHLAFVEHLSMHALDYSIDSLQAVDEYLLVIRENKDLLTQAQYGDVVVWSGCYVGETIRKNASIDCKWVSYDDFVHDAGTQSLVKPGEFPRTLGSLFVLIAGDTFTIPLSKVQKFIEGGTENSLHAYAASWLKPQSGKQAITAENINVPAAQPNAELENALLATRKKFALKRLLLNRWTYGSTAVQAPDWLAEKDPLAEVFDKQLFLHQEGQIVWGALVQAHSQLFTAGETDHPALLVYSTDPHFDSRPHELRAIAKTIFKLKNGSHSDPAVQRYAKLVTDELDHGKGWKLPKALTAQNVRCAAFMVFRKHLPNNILAAAWFPIFTHESTSAVMMVPEKFWPEKLTEMWNAKQLLSAD